MRNGLTRLVNPASRISEVDLESTREARARVHEEVRLHQRLAVILALSSPGDGTVRAEPMSPEEWAAGGESPWGGEAA